MDAIFSSLTRGLCRKSTSFEKNSSMKKRKTDEINQKAKDAAARGQCKITNQQEVVDTMNYLFCLLCL